MEYQSQEIGELAAALASAQAELEPALKNAKNPMLKNRYADLASCYEACRKVLPQKGLAVSQICLPSEKGSVCVKTILMHTSGQWIASECTLEAQGNKGVNSAQAAGSAITYARRYGLSAIVGLVSDDDDDGCTAGPTGEEKHIAERQAAKAENKNPITEDQQKAFWVSMAKYRSQVANKEEYAQKAYELLGEFFGRKITTLSQITKDEMSEYLSANAKDNPF